MFTSKNHYAFVFSKFLWNIIWLIFLERKVIKESKTIWKFFSLISVAFEKQRFVHRTKIVLHRCNHQTYRYISPGRSFRITGANYRIIKRINTCLLLQMQQRVNIFKPFGYCILYLFLGKQSVCYLDKSNYTRIWINNYSDVCPIY